MKLHKIRYDNHNEAICGKFTNEIQNTHDETLDVGLIDYDTGDLNCGACFKHLQVDGKQTLCGTNWDRNESNVWDEPESDRHGNVKEEGWCNVCLEEWDRLYHSNLDGTAIFKEEPENFDVDFRTNHPVSMEKNKEGKFYCVIFESQYPASNSIRTQKNVLGSDYDKLFKFTFRR